MGSCKKPTLCEKRPHARGINNRTRSARTLATVKKGIDSCTEQSISTRTSTVRCSQVYTWKIGLRSSFTNAEGRGNIFQPINKARLCRQCLSVHIFTIIYFKENRSGFILEIKKNPPVASYAKREFIFKTAQFLYVKSRISPVFFKTLFLHQIKLSRFPRKFFERSIKAFGADNIHRDTGYCLRAFLSERRIRCG